MGQAMTKPTQRIPWWLTVDLSMMFVSLIIIGIGAIGIGMAP
jgi:hypothetical protein